jgi:hypothetical protein
MSGVDWIERPAKERYRAVMRVSVGLMGGVRRQRSSRCGAAAE